MTRVVGGPSFGTEFLRRRRWLAAFPAVAAAIFVVASALRPSFATEAAVLIPPYDEWGGMEALARNIVTNERFLSTQVAVLSSDSVLADALRRTRGGGVPAPAEVRKLRKRLTMIREPFNNLVRIRLSLPRPDIVQALIEAFEARFRDAALAGARRRADVLRLTIEDADERLASAEADLAALGGSAGRQARAAGRSVADASSAGESHEARRQRLLAEIQAAAAQRGNASAELRAVRWSVDEPRQFVEILSGPTPPARTNGLTRSALRGFLAGVFLVLLALYGLVAWRPGVRRG